MTYYFCNISSLSVWRVQLADVSFSVYIYMLGHYIEKGFQIFSELLGNGLISRWHVIIGAINVHWPAKDRRYPFAFSLSFS